MPDYSCPPSRAAVAGRSPMPARRSYNDRVACQRPKQTMTDLWDNPMGTDGFEFVEYAAPDPKTLGRLFETMGFTAVARHRQKDVTLFRQGDINFIINGEAGSFGQSFARIHGPCVC